MRLSENAKYSFLPIPIANLLLLSHLVITIQISSCNLNFRILRPLGQQKSKCWKCRLEALALTVVILLLFCHLSGKASSHLLNAFFILVEFMIHRRELEKGQLWSSNPEVMSSSVHVYSFACFLFDSFPSVKVPVSVM